MDKSLDDMIATRPKTGRRGAGPRRGSARAQVLGKSPASPVTRARAAASASPAPQQSSQPANKIIVSNLPIDVNEAQIKELFATTVGPLREVNLSYDSNGKSKGVAQVHFSRQGDGNKAFQQYNNRLIDGKRPMKIEIIVDPSRVPLASRVGAAQNGAATAAAAGTGGASRGKPAGRGRGSARGGRRTNERPKKTAEDLDAEMEDYSAANGGADAAAPAAETAA